MKNASSVRINKDYLPQIGESIMAYGFAGGNSLVRCIEAKVAEMLTGGKIRVDRAFIHGMSGSPVVNTRGEVIGVLAGGSAPDDYSHDGEFILFSTIEDRFSTYLHDFLEQ